MTSDDTPAPPPDAVHQASDDTLQKLARSCADERRLRARHLPTSLLGEPAWDILLEAFLCDGRGHPLTIASACAAAHVPASTAIRHLHRLVIKGLIDRHPSADDRRVVTLALTPSGRARMAGYLTTLATRRAASTTVASALAPDGGGGSR